MEHKDRGMRSTLRLNLLGETTKIHTGDLLLRTAEEYGNKDSKYLLRRKEMIKIVRREKIQMSHQEQTPITPMFSTPEAFKELHWYSKIKMPL